MRKLARITTVDGFAPIEGADQRSGLVWVHPDGRVEWKRKCKINHSPEALPQLTVFNLAWRAAKGESRSF